MSELRLAGNFINFTGILGSYGHLQIVFVDDDGTQLENEVQSPPSVFFGTCISGRVRSILDALYMLISTREPQNSCGKCNVFPHLYICFWWKLKHIC